MDGSSVNSAIRLGVEITGKHLAVVCLDSAASVIDKKLGDRTDENFLSDFVKSSSATHGPIAGVGIASSSECDSDTASISADLFKMVGSKPFVENSGRAGAIGEHRAGAGKGTQSLFYIYMGETVETALILNGEVWRGSAGLAGAFGRFVIDSDGRRVDDFATDLSIVRRTRNRFNQDQTSSLISLDESKITADDIIREALKGDEFAVMMLERTGKFVGVALASVIHLLNPETVVVGGQIVRPGTNVVEGVISGAGESVSSEILAGTKIIPADLGEFSAALGVALMSADC